MTEKRRGLGRGLGALIPAAPVREHHGRGDDGGAEHRPSAVGAQTAAPPEQPVSAPGVPPSASSARPQAPRPLDVFFPERRTSAAPPASGVIAASAESAPPTRSTEGSSVEAVPGAAFAEIPVAAITPNPRQPRGDFNEEEMAELVHSIREVGLLQPVVVRDTGPGRYELVMGERRWRACRDAGLERIPAIVRTTGDDAMLRDALLENLHRSQLNALEEAAAYDQLLADFGCTHEDLARRIGRSRPQISNTLRLLRLPPPVQRRVAAGVLTAGHARALLGLEDQAAVERLATRIVAEGLSVRAVEEIVALGGTAAATNAASESTRAPAGEVRRAGRPSAPGLDHLAARLSDRFETRVKVDLGRTKGKIVVEFASVDDLERIIAVMAPDAPQPSAGSG